MGFLGSITGDPDTWTLTEVNVLLLNIVTVATTIAGGVAIFYLLLGAFQYFTAFGDEAKATKAKDTILWAIVGIVVILIGKIIIYEVWNLVAGRPTLIP